MTMYPNTTTMTFYIRIVFLILLIYQTTHHLIQCYVCSVPDKWLPFDDISKYNANATSWSNETVSVQKWPGGVVKYKLNATLTAEDKKQVLGAFEEFHTKTCIRFEPFKEGDKNFVSIETDDSVCGLAQLCMGSGYQFAKFGKNCRRKNAMVHELGHTICLSHVTKRDHSDKTISSGCRRRQEDTSDRVYDVLSQMHTDCHTVRIHCGYEITSGLSTLDADVINAMYNCQGCYRHRWIPINAMRPSDFVNLHNFGFKDLDGQNLYPCRAYFKNQIIVGKFKLRAGTCFLGHSRGEHVLCEQFEVLTIPGGLIAKDSKYSLVTAHAGMPLEEQNVMFEAAVVGGRENLADGTGNGNGCIAFGIVPDSNCSNIWWPGFFNTTNIEVIGTVWRHMNKSVATASFCGKELKLESYQVLVCKQINLTEVSPDVNLRTRPRSRIGKSLANNSTSHTASNATAEETASEIDNARTLKPSVDAQSEHGNPNSRHTGAGAGNEDRSLFIWVGAIGAVMLIVLTGSTIFGFLRIRRLQRKLDQNEIREFFDGQRDRKASTEKGNEYITYNALTVPYDKSFEILRRNLEIEQEVLGSGQFGCVYKALIKGKDGSLEVALKTTKGDAPKIAIKGILSEIKVLTYLGTHPNIVMLRGAYTAELHNGIVYVATELCGLGSLEDYLRGNQSYSNKPNSSTEINSKSQDEIVPRNVKTTVAFQDMVRWSHEIACGMEYIGTKHIVHADLATRNVLLTTEKTAKITDFGLSRRIYDYQNYVKTHQEPLPWRWMAIESLKRCEFSAQSDVWSYGVTLWEIFTMGDIPYPGLSWTADFTNSVVNGLRLDCPQFASPDIYDVMTRCWNLDPRDRPTFADIKDSTGNLMRNVSVSLESDDVSD